MTTKNKSLQEWVREDKLLLVEDASGKQSLYKQSANTNDKLLLYVAETAQEMKNYFRTRNVGAMPDVVAEDKLDEYTFPGENKTLNSRERTRTADHIKDMRFHASRIKNELAQGRLTSREAAKQQDVYLAPDSRNNNYGSVDSEASAAAQLLSRAHPGSSEYQDEFYGANAAGHERAQWAPDHEETPYETNFDKGVAGYKADKMGQAMDYLYQAGHKEAARGALSKRVDRARWDAHQNESKEEVMSNRLEEASMFQGGPDNMTTGNPPMDYRTYLAAELFGSTSFASQVPTADTHQAQVAIQGEQAVEGMGVLRPSGAPANNMYEQSISNQLIKLTKNLFRAGKIDEAAKIADALEQPQNAAAFVLEAAMATDGSVDASLTEDLYRTAAILNNLEG